MKIFTIRKKREITLETTRQIVVRDLDPPEATRCQTCAAGMVTVDQAAAMTGTTSRSVYRAVEREELHFSETAAGLLLVCVNSLSAVRSKKVLLPFLMLLLLAPVAHPSFAHGNHSGVECTILNRFRHVRRLDPLASFEVGDRSRNLQDAVVRAG